MNNATDQLSRCSVSVILAVYNGKRYVAALRGMWGVRDVEDAVGAARYLVGAGLADPDRLVIMGSSAG